MSSNPLFIGRFQPFHKGHLDVVRQILKKHKRLIIGIGSAQYSKVRLNPFPFSVRKRMIAESLREAKIPALKFTIVKIVDIHNDRKWVSHVEKIAGRFGDVYTGTPHVQKLFKKDGKHNVITPRFHFRISGTMIRKKIARGEPWQKFVPPFVSRLIDSRLRGNDSLWK